MKILNHSGIPIQDGHQNKHILVIQLAQKMYASKSNQPNIHWHLTQGFLSGQQIIRISKRVEEQESDCRRKPWTKMHGGLALSRRRAAGQVRPAMGADLRAGPGAQGNPSGGIHRRAEQVVRTVCFAILDPTVFNRALLSEKGDKEQSVDSTLINATNCRWKYSERNCIHTHQAWLPQRIQCRHSQSICSVLGVMNNLEVT
jgi:hypothetical protein